MSTKWLTLAALLGMACTPTVNVHFHKETITTTAQPATGYGFAMRRRDHRIPQVYAVMGVPYNNIVATTECD